LVRFIDSISFKDHFTDGHGCRWRASTLVESTIEITGTIERSSLNGLLARGCRSRAVIADLLKVRLTLSFGRAGQPWAKWIESDLKSTGMT